MGFFAWDFDDDRVALALDIIDVHIFAHLDLMRVLVLVTE